MRKLLKMTAAAIVVMPSSLFAQEVIDLTIASSHPTVIPWVGMMQTHFMAKTDEILAETGNYEINWNEAFGGTLYKANATLSSVEEGITDVGWVFSMLEPAKLPLSQLSSYAPFSTANPKVMLTVMQDLMENNEALKEEWEQYNLKVLGLTGTDMYDIYTKEPIESIEDINGMKISAPGVLGTWLRGTGANAVDGALTTFYTDIQTGVSDGVLTLALGAKPAKLYEVAPYLNRFDAAVAFSGAIAINRDVWDTLPEEVQDAMLEAGKYYTDAHGTQLLEGHEQALLDMVELGKDQNPPVTLVEMPDDQREAWVALLPDLAGEWAESQGPAAQEMLSAYMQGLRDAGETPVRDWDKQ